MIFLWWILGCFFYLLIGSFVVSILDRLDIITNTDRESAVTTLLTFLAVVWPALVGIMLIVGVCYSLGRLVWYLSQCFNSLFDYVAALREKVR